MRPVRIGPEASWRAQAELVGEEEEGLVKAPVEADRDRPTIPLRDVSGELASELRPRPPFGAARDERTTAYVEGRFG